MRIGKSPDEWAGSPQSSLKTLSLCSIMQVLAPRNREAVTHRSPGSPRSGAPWDRIKAIPYAEGVIKLVVGIVLFNPFGVSAL
jgi:hypothetical protein